MRQRLFVFLVVFEGLVALAHWFLYVSWVHAFGRPAWLAPVTVFLGVSFVAASLLAFRFYNPAVRWLYRLAAAWTGIANYLMPAAVMTWLLPRWAAAWFGAGAAVGIYGIVNAAITRVRRVEVTLAGLPAAWRGREVALVSDLHLGHVRNLGFVRRLVERLRALAPAAVFIVGDLFDGTAADLPPLCAPWRNFPAPVFFVAGNHEGFGGRAKYLEAVAAAGVRVLHNERVELEGLQVVGVHFTEAADPARLRALLAGARLDPERASILLNHAPDHLQVAADAGISLQLSGHTHGGQFFPFTLVVRRLYGRFAHGLQRLDGMQVFVNFGAGTWGPPLRVGTYPEIVMLRLR